MLFRSADGFEKCEPVYIEMPGWEESTVGVKNIADLPQNARDSLSKIDTLSGVPVDVVSTGPDRSETIVLRHPFGNS